MEVYELPEKELEITVIKMLRVLRKHILARLKGGKCKTMEILISLGPLVFMAAQPYGESGWGDAWGL